MTHRTWTVFAYLVGGALLLAAACAPAAAPKPAAEAPKPAAEQPKPAAEQPKPAAEQPKPAAEAPKPAAPQPAKAAAVPPGEVGAKRGGVLIYANNTHPPSFNPWEEAIGQEVTAAANGLLQYKSWGSRSDPDYQTILPDLARSWEWSADGLSLTLRLRDGVKFHDGVAFSCTDAKFTLDTIRTGQGLRRSPRALFFRAVTEVTCADPLTVVVKLARPQASVPASIAIGYHPVWPAHLYAKDPASIRTSNPVGTGPFRFVRYLPGEVIVFERNKEYWNQPYPYLDGVEFRNVGTLAAVDSAIRARRAHLLSTTRLLGARAETLIKECAHCTVLEKSWTNSFHALHINYLRSPWDTPEVRDAIAYAIDRNKVRDVAFQGWYYPGGGIFHPMNKPWSAAEEPWLKEVPGYNLADPEGNRKKARELLAKAGYRPGELRLTLNVWASSADIRAAAIPVQEDLNAVGFAVELKNVETARGYEILGAGDFEVMPWSLGAGILDPDGVFYEHYYTGSDRNYGRYSNPEVDRLIDLQSMTLDPAERVRLVHRASEIILREQAKIILGWILHQSIYPKVVRNHVELNCLTCTSPGRFERVWLAE